METVWEKAFAKLNLTLDVTAGRRDGYHDLAMVMISVDLHDDVGITLRQDGQITCHSNFRWIPNDERNLAVRAVKAFREAVCEPALGADIEMKKRVPVGAGMAGGSTDAAAVLRAMNRITGAGLSVEKLREIGLSIGSDVPYCVAGGAMLARGRGELLTPLTELPAWPIVICKPAFSVSTGELFARVDARRTHTRPDTDGMCRAMAEGDLAGVSRRMFNVFEDVLPRNCREVLSVRSQLLDLGATGTVMTGTGSAVFGLFAENDAAEAAQKALSASYRECFLTHPIPRLFNQT